VILAPQTHGAGRRAFAGAVVAQALLLGACAGAAVPRSPLPADSDGPDDSPQSRADSGVPNDSQQSQADSGAPDDSQQSQADADGPGDLLAEDNAAASEADASSDQDAAGAGPSNCGTATVVTDVEETGFTGVVFFQGNLSFKPTPDLGYPAVHWYLKQHPGVPGLDWSSFVFTPNPYLHKVQFKSEVPGDYQACVSIKPASGQKCMDLCVTLKFPLPSHRTFVFVHQPVSLTRGADCWGMVRLQGTSIAKSCPTAGACCATASGWPWTASLFDLLWWPDEVVWLPSGATAVAFKGGDLPAADTLVIPPGVGETDDGIRVAIERISLSGLYARNPVACGPYVVSVLAYDKGSLLWTVGPLSVSGNDIAEIGVIQVGAGMAKPSLLPCQVGTATCTSPGTCAMPAGP